MPNITRLDATLAYTKAHPDEWNQTQWAWPLTGLDGTVCGTACCFAGNALLAEGYSFEWTQYADLVVFDPNGQRMDGDGDSHIPTLARTLLRPECRSGR